MSKMDTLKLAIDYINFLSGMTSITIIRVNVNLSLIFLFVILVIIDNVILIIIIVRAGSPYRQNRQMSGAPRPRGPRGALQGHL